MPPSGKERYLSTNFNSRSVPLCIQSAVGAHSLVDFFNLLPFLVLKVRWNSKQYYHSYNTK